MAGLSLRFFGVRRLCLAGTSVMPGKPATKLLTLGVYRVTHNPIYIGFILLYVGLSMVLTSVWILLFLIPVMLILYRGVMLREEACSSRKFGDEYARCTERVPRWL